MKSKYVLHGGFTAGNTNEDNSKFYTEILKEAPEEAQVLLVCFAKDDDRVKSENDKVIAEFNKNKWQIKLHYETANKEKFTEQVKKSDVIYIHGGNSLRLYETLKGFSALPELLAHNKIVAGESAGANVLCKYFYSKNTDQVSEGLGIIPVKIIPHYTEQYKSKLDGVGQNIDKLYLAEYKYKVFK